MTWWFAVLAGLAGLAFGSFANVAVYRIPRGLSVISPSSACPKCRRPIAWYDNIPVLSYALLRGRCRQCVSPVSSRYPLVEVLAAASWVAVVVRIGLHPELPAYLGLATFLVILGAIDAEHQRLPNRVLAPACLVAVAGFGLAVLLGRPLVLVEHAFIGAASYGLVMLVIHLAIPAGMGAGDVKFAPYLGFHLGWLGLWYVPMGALLGFILGSLGALGLVAAGLKTRQDRIAFGPFMAAGAFIVVLGGPTLHRWIA